MHPPRDPQPPGVEDCLRRLAGGDPSAGDAILGLCHGRLRLLARRMLSRFPNVRRWDDTDDVLQNASLRLLRGLRRPGAAPPRSIMAVAATEIRRELLDLARRNAGPASFAANHATHLGRGPYGVAGPDAVLAAAPAPDEPLGRWTRFHAAIDALPQAGREVFQLVWYLGADQETVARLLGCSTRTVKSRWRAAREAVRLALDGVPPG